MEQIDVGVFSVNTPLVLAQSRGWFVEAGVEVVLHGVTSSEEQFRDLDSGRYTLVLTAFDNVLNYAHNASNALGHALPLEVLRAVDAGMNLSLVAHPDIHGLADLADRRLAVDAPDSGFAYLAYEALDEVGIQGRYEIVRLGGVGLRYQRMLAGEADGTLLSNGFEVLALQQGLQVLANPEGLTTPYLGAVFASTRSRVSSHQDTLAVFGRVYDHAVTTVLGGPADTEVIAAIAAARSVDLDVAAQLLDAERSSYGLLADGKVDREAALSVARLRARYGGFDTALDPEIVVDGILGPR